VLASGADYLGDALGAGLSLTALRLSRRDHGHPRATTLAGAGQLELPAHHDPDVAGEAIHRLMTGAPSIHGLPVVIARTEGLGHVVVGSRRETYS
jgi:hypothetical protein